MNDLTLKARLVDADPNMIEKYGLTAAAGGNLRERFIPGYANKRYGKAGVQRANQNAVTGADSLTRNTQEMNQLALQERQAGAEKTVSNFNPAVKRPLGRDAGRFSDKQNEANQRVALQAANRSSGATAELKPIIPMGQQSMGQQSPGANQSTEVPDSLNTEQKLDANGNVIESTQTVSNEEPKPEESGVVPEVPPTGATPPTTNVPLPPTGGTPPPPTGATPPPAGGGGLQVDAQVGTNNNRNQATGGNVGQTFNFGNMGGGGQAQPQQQQKPQVTPQQQAAV